VPNIGAIQSQGTYSPRDIGAVQVTIVGPVLTNPTGTKTGFATADGTVDTDTASGVLYAVVTESATQPTEAQIKAGQDHAGASAAFSDSQSISTTGTKSFSASGLTDNTTYYFHYVHTNADDLDSNIVSSASFTTDEIPSLEDENRVQLEARYEPTIGLDATYTSRINLNATYTATIDLIAESG